MKFIKTYEQYNDGDIYWQMNTKKPYFKFILKKIGIPEKRANHWDNMFERPEDIFVFKHPNRDRIWSFSLIDNTNWEIEHKFMGKIEATDVDIDADKYNL